MELTCCLNTTLYPTAPFNFDATFFKPDHFPTADSYFEPGIRWQTMLWKETRLGLVFNNTGTVAAPEIDLTIHSTKTLSSEFIQALTDEVTYRFNLHLDLAGFYASATRDTSLKQATDSLFGMRPAHAGSLYEYLIIGILLQNTTVRRSMAMMQALFEHYGVLLEFDGKKLWSFWEPGALNSVSEDDLRNLKLGYRAKFIKRVDEAFAEGGISEPGMRILSRDEQRQELLRLYGVGPATVWYILFDVFHDFDALTYISPWEQKIYSKILFNTDPETPVAVEKLLNYCVRFKPYRMLAVHYLWEDVWWKRNTEETAWLEKLIRR